MASRKNEPRATAAWYDGTSRRVVMELGTGYRVGIPLARLKEIAGATPTELESIEILGGGNILHWERLDADYSVPALVLDLVGPALLAREAARAAGQATSPRKAAAARRNGRKGGRPKKLKRG